MARVHVYLPDDLYEQVRARGLPASDLLQCAVRAELRRLDLPVETDRYVEETIAEFGPPTEDELAQAADLARRIQRHSARPVPRQGSWRPS